MCAAGASGSASAATETDFEAAVEAVRPAAEALGATQFEALTAAALLAFATANVDVAVVEAGLGGRHDATNVLHTRVVVLTSVALDHMDVLGDTREEIAAEKLAVVQPGCTVVLSEPEWRELAEENGAAAVVVTARSNLALAVAAAESFLDAPVDGHAADERRAGGPARAPGRAAARDLGRRSQPRRHRLAAAAAPVEVARRLDGRLLDPARQAARDDARGAVRPRLDARRDREPKRSRAPRAGSSPRSPRPTSTGSRWSPSRRPLVPARWSLQARTGPCSSRAPCTFSRISVPRTAPHDTGEKLSMFALAAFVLITAIGSAFATGWVIGRIVL